MKNGRNTAGHFAAGNTGLTKRNMQIAKNNAATFKSKTLNHIQVLQCKLQIVESMLSKPHGDHYE